MSVVIKRRYDIIESGIELEDLVAFGAGVRRSGSVHLANHIHITGHEGVWTNPYNRPCCFLQPGNTS